GDLRTSLPPDDGADELRRHEELLVGQRPGGGARRDSNGAPPDLPVEGLPGRVLRPHVSRARLPAPGRSPVSALIAPISARFPPAGRLIMLAAGRDLVGLDQAILEQAVGGRAGEPARGEAARATPGA